MAASELGTEKWAVISERGCEATCLTYEDARRLVHQLAAEGRHGLCIVTNEAASRMIAPNDANQPIAANDLQSS
jgi:hypothetical protein